MQDKRGNTPLHIAALRNDTEMLAYLLAKESPVLKQNSQMKTALDIAIVKNNLSAVQRLVRKDHHCLAIRNRKGYTSLLQAVALQRYDIVKWLLDKAGANVFEAGNQYGVTALSLAAKHLDRNITLLLLNRGAGIKADLTDIDLSGIDLKNMVLIGAERQGRPAAYKCINTAQGLAEATFRGLPLHYRALGYAITARLEEFPGDSELLKAQKSINCTNRYPVIRGMMRSHSTGSLPDEAVLSSTACKRT